MDKTYRLTLFDIVTDKGKLDRHVVDFVSSEPMEDVDDIYQEALGSASEAIGATAESFESHTWEEIKESETTVIEVVGIDSEETQGYTSTRVALEFYGKPTDTDIHQRLELMYGPVREFYVDGD